VSPRCRGDDQLGAAPVPARLELGVSPGEKRDEVRDDL
jgi:hypothetical protein